ncbi:AP-3 complex subunit sigma-like isoform X1 [Cucurbita moschata]|uniref:AP-3 complex subunit sigma-like isoform X1 n=1 Tax=Cucurbita moschata TaxID=3662 RepID=A0A6J1GFN8_CUCMO|nr:AP-3 complex subunit sigma-like isoform X1 [Cucurbita moschata]
MIRAVIVMNTQGKPRFAKFYDFQPVEKQQELIRSVHGVLCSRAENLSNFVEAESIFGPDSRLVYKHFATLYFVFVFNSSENELAMLDLIQVFVETLDKCFKNVCELDLVFHYTKVRNSLEFYQLCLQNSFWLAGLSLLFKASGLSNSACIPLMPCLQIITRSVVLAMTDYLDSQVNKLSYSWTTHLPH